MSRIKNSCRHAATNFLALCVLIAITHTPRSLAQGSSEHAAQKSKIVDDFSARVNHYLEMRKDTAGAPPKPTTSTDKIARGEQQMASRVGAARSGAKQGDIFTPEIAAYFRQQIVRTLNGPQGNRIRASLRHAEPVKNISLQVNQTYPPGIPLQSTPPSLLANLPLLPKDLEYRIVGRTLVLHDLAANLVVDFVPDAIPSP